jgi:hypothetical protein
MSSPMAPNRMTVSVSPPSSLISRASPRSCRSCQRKLSSSASVFEYLRGTNKMAQPVTPNRTCKFSLNSPQHQVDYVHLAVWSQSNLAPSIENAGVPTGITGNELADRFAKATTLFPALDRSACKPSWQAASALIHRNLQQRWNNEWQASRNLQKNILRRKLQASGAPAWPPPHNFLVSTTLTTLALDKFIKSLRPIS